MPFTTTNTDDALLNMMCSDDQEAFTLIYRRYWQTLFITAAKALRSSQEAKDVVQDVFLSPGTEGKSCKSKDRWPPIFNQVSGTRPSIILTRRSKN